MMEAIRTCEIAVVLGDGIGPEVCRPTIDVLKAALGESRSRIDLPRRFLT